MDLKYLGVKHRDIHNLKQFSKKHLDEANTAKCSLLNPGSGYMDVHVLLFSPLFRVFEIFHNKKFKKN